MYFLGSYLHFPSLVLRLTWCITCSHALLTTSMQLEGLRKISVLAMVVSLQNDRVSLSISENGQISFMNGLSSRILSIHEGNDPLDVLFLGKYLVVKVLNSLYLLKMEQSMIFIQPVVISVVLLPKT